MTQEHPITPPPELILEWCRGWNCTSELTALRGVATQAARWGADQELKACRLWADATGWKGAGKSLQLVRRPEPPSLKEQALGLLNEGPVSDLLDHEVETIRRALESLPD